MPETPDVLEQGGSRRPRRPRRRWPVVLGVVVLLAAVVAYGGLRRPDLARLPDLWRAAIGDRAGDGGDRGDDRGGDRGIADGPGWSAPSRPGRCGTTVLPRWKARGLPEGTGVSVLTGGPVLARVDLDTGRRRVLLDPAKAGRPDAFVTDVARLGHTVYALVGDCRDDEGVLYVLRGGARPRAVGGHHVARLLAGPAGVWTVTYPEGRNGTVVLHGVGGPTGPTGRSGRTFRLPSGTDAEGVTAAGVVVTRDRETPLHPQLSLLDAGTGKVRRELGQGYTMSVTGRDLMWYGTVGCNDIGAEDDDPCDVRRTDLRGKAQGRTYPLPAGRMIRRDSARLAPDGRRLAFLVNRYVPEARNEPSRILTEVAVLDLGTGRLTTVPDVRLPVATFGDAEIGLAFAGSGRLVISIGEGDRGRLLLWTPGTGGLRLVPGPIPGPIDGYAPVVEAP